MMAAAARHTITSNTPYGFPRGWINCVDVVVIVDVGGIGVSVTTVVVVLVV